MTKVKICGVTNIEDALLVTNLGAEFIGFNLFKDSPRKVAVNTARDIISKLPPFITPVGVFVDEELETAAKTAKKCDFKLVQLHGRETPDYCRQLFKLTAMPVIKAFRVKDESVLQEIPAYKELVKYILLDAYVPGEPGGTGETFNWDIALKAADIGIPAFLAGGLTPENVESAIEKVHPFGVDVCSGVERLQRRKDFDRMKAFIRNVRGL
jgi:phosphoribosylanthranilate isomerase